MTQLQAFISRVERHISETGISATAFGKMAVADPKFVFDLRNGRTPNLKIVDRVEEFMRAASNQPESAKMVNGEAA